MKNEKICDLYIERDQAYDGAVIECPTSSIALHPAFEVWLTAMNMYEVLGEFLNDVDTFDALFGPKPERIVANELFLYKELTIARQDLARGIQALHKITELPSYFKPKDEELVVEKDRQ